MRHAALACLALAASLALAPAAAAQQPPLRMRIEKVDVGFRGQVQEDFGTFKPGLWAPVHVTLVAAPDGPIVLPVAKDNTVRGELRVETGDSDGIANVYSEPFTERRQERLHLIAYARSAASGRELKVTVRPGNAGDRAGPGDYSGKPDRYLALELHDHLYLGVGAPLPDLQKALIELAGKKEEEKDTRPRHLTHETDVRRLPKRWQGYQAVDFLILTTDNKTFLQELLKPENAPRVEALAGWVRRGGRLLLSVSWANQELVNSLLGAKAHGSNEELWGTALKAIVPADRGKAAIPPLDHAFAALKTWAGSTKPFFGEKAQALPIARLLRHPTAEVAVEEADGNLLLLRAPYGLGSVTFLAIAVDQQPFTLWKGKIEFWKATLKNLAPPILEANLRQAAGGPGGMTDVTSELHEQLDRFGETKPIGFGLVALFILLYILVVGPLDYFLLKKVFNRLELTWITFPAVVLGISLIAYFTAYAVKGKDLKVNKLDLIDLDMRSDLDERLRTKGAHAYGTTWFTVLSPRIQSYTIGIEPVFPRQVGGDPKEAAPQALVTWLGRPEAGGMQGMGGQRSQGLFTRTYVYARDGAGLRDVPIPVWSTKAFTASWDAPLKTAPFTVRLQYDPADPNRVSGTIRNELPLDLQEVALVYGDKAYPLSDCLRGEDLKIANLQDMRPEDIHKWISRARWANPAADNRFERRGQEAVPQESLYEPGSVLRELLFHERLAGRTLNHAQRPLDQSWRLQPDWRRSGPVVRDAILVGRLPRARGAGESVTAEGKVNVPTHLWLGGPSSPLPGGEDARPELSGTLVQDTYVRILLPVTPANR